MVRKDLRRLERMMPFPLNMLTGFQGLMMVRVLHIEKERRTYIFLLDGNRPCLHVKYVAQNVRQRLTVTLKLTRVDHSDNPAMHSSEEPAIRAEWERLGGDRWWDSTREFAAICDERENRSVPPHHFKLLPDYARLDLMLQAQKPKAEYGRAVVARLRDRFHAFTCEQYALWERAYR